MLANVTGSEEVGHGEDGVEEEEGGHHAEGHDAEELVAVPPEDEDEGEEEEEEGDDEEDGEGAGGEPLEGEGGGVRGRGLAEVDQLVRGCEVLRWSGKRNEKSRK